MTEKEVITITPRKVAFDWEGVPLHFVPDDPFTSHAINIFHIALPAGENWFCKLYAEAIPYLEDNPKLKADAIGFMRQEAMHSRAHQSVLKHYADQGVDVRDVTEFIEEELNRFAGDKIHGLREPRTEAEKKAWLVKRLGITAVIEHFTCVLSVWLFQQKGLDRSGANADMLDLLKWHCAEEIEHRAVAYDIYMHLSGDNHWQRYRLMAQVVPGLYFLMRRCFAALVRNDPSFDGKPGFHRGWRASAKQGRLPSLWSVLMSTKSWFSKGYDPLTEAETQTAIDYFETSPVLNRMKALEAAE